MGTQQVEARLRQCRARVVSLFTAVSMLVSFSAAAQTPMHDVLLVGNIWDGTADVIDVRTYQRLKRINLIPDQSERMLELLSDPARLTYFLLIREQVGEGHDQFVDDMFAS